MDPENREDEHWVEIKELNQFRHRGCDYLEIIVEIEGEDHHYIIGRWFPPKEVKE